MELAVKHHTRGRSKKDTLSASLALVGERLADVHERRKRLRSLSGSRRKAAALGLRLERESIEQTLAVLKRQSRAGER